MKDFPSFEYHHNKSSDTLDIVMHGISSGISSPFIQNVISICKNADHSVLAFNFPFFERGEEQSSGPELKEEIETLEKLMDFCHANKYKEIRLIGKSLGAITAGLFLKKIPTYDHKKFTLIVLGYPLKYIDINSFTGKTFIIQGEKDKFGGIKEVKKHLKNAKSDKINFFEVKCADHSFRDPTTKEPIYEKDALKILSSL